MTISLEYIGAAERYFETASTGKSQSWRRGQTQDVSDTDAALLMATGLFAYGSADAQPESNIAPGFPVKLISWEEYIFRSKRRRGIGDTCLSSSDFAYGIQSLK